MRFKPNSCLGCELHSHGRDFSAVEGTGANGVMLVGEASGEHEQRDGLPFRPYAPAGAVLERCLRRMGLDRKQFAITNTIRCRPRNNWLEGSPFEFAALRHCRPNLDAAIAAYKPRSIVALGGVATRELTGEAGESLGVTHLAGYVLPLGYRPHDFEAKPADALAEPTPVICNFHPSFLRRGKASHQGVFSRIIQRALTIASGRDRQFIWGIDPEDETTWLQPDGSRLQYWTHPTLDQARSFYYYLRDNPALLFSADLETSESSSLDEDAREGFSDTEIRLVQFSYQPGTGIALPWEGGFKQVAIDILHLPNKMYGHNFSNFDHKVLRAAAAREGWKYAPRERVFDTLDMFHHWQPDLPAHLQFAASFINFPFPWKHLAATDIEFYGISDVDADLRLGLFLEATLKRDQLWGEGDAYSLTLGYTGQEREVRPVLAAMEDRGVPIDDARRIALGEEFERAQEELGAELDGRFPDEARSIHPKEGYKKEPKDTTGLVRREFTIAALTEDTGDPTHKSVERWCRLENFAPNSSQQLLRYMKHHGHPVPKSKEENSEGKQKDTTAAKMLQRLAIKTSDDFYLKVIEYRGLTKLRGTYVDGFRPGADGRVHPTFTFSTAIAQLAARNPNTTNFPKLKPTPDLAKAMRAMICAPEGKIITEMDWKSCHVITLGLLAGDANYTRLGRLDIHSAVAGHFLGHWNLREIMKETDDQLMARFHWLKSDPERKRVRDDQAKHGILGIGNGLRAKGLYERYMESFPARGCPVCSGTGKVAGVRGLKNCGDCGGTGKQSGLSIAEAVLTTCEELFPAVFAYQEAQRREAHERQQLRNPFGHMRRFYEVYRWDGRKACWGHGDQAEEAVAYRLASVAHAHMRELLKELGRNGMAEHYGLFNMVHDSLMLCHDESLREDVIRDVVPVMMAESKVLPGLWLGVEASQGRRWSEMETVDVDAAVVVKEATCSA
jgi:uracil-DNA glycosylase family 4